MASHGTPLKRTGRTATTELTLKLVKRQGKSRKRAARLRFNKRLASGRRSFTEFAFPKQAMIAQMQMKLGNVAAVRAPGVFDRGLCGR